MQKDLISVILPCYNVERWLDDCFKSIKAQTYQNIEVIFVDDGSKDNTLKMIENFCKSDERFKFVSKPNGGVSSARNVGLAAANGEFVAFCDPDDILPSNYFEYLINYFVINPNLDCCYCGVRWFSEDKTRETIKFKDKKLKYKKYSNVQELFEEMFALKFFWSVCDKLYKMENLTKFKSFPNIFNVSTTYIEDLEMNIKYFLNFPQFLVADKKMYYYRQRKGSAMHSKFYDKMLTIYNAFDLALSLDKVKFKNCQNNFNAVYAMSSQEFLFRIIHTKDYNNYNVVKDLYQTFKNKRKYVYKSKNMPFWLKLAIPFSSLYFMFAANIKICRCKQYEKKAQKIKK